jgi:hypothetical protein
VNADRFAELDAAAAEWEVVRAVDGQAIAFRLGQGVIADVGIDALAEWAQAHDVLLLDEDGAALW